VTEVIRKRYAVVMVLMMLCCCMLELIFSAQAVTTKLRVAVNCGFPVYQFCDEDGNCVGIHIDILNDISANRSLEIEYIKFDSDSACFEALKKGEADVVLGAKQTVPSGYDFQLTDVITTSTLCLVVPNAIADEIARTKKTGEYLCAAESWYNFSGALTGKSALGIWSGMFKMCDSQNEVMEFLTSRKVDVAMCEKQSALYLLEQYGVSDEYTIAINYLASTEYAILVRSNDSSLLRILNAGIQETRASGEYEKILETWLDNGESMLSPRMIKLILLIGGSIVSVVLIYALFNRRLNLLLKRKVNEKTGELQRVNATLEEKMLQLQNESEVRNSIIENSPSAMVLFDTDYKISFMNACAMNLAGMMGGTPVGASVENMGVFGDILKRKGHSVFADTGFNMLPEIAEINENGKKQFYRYIIYRLFNYRELTGALLAVENVTQEEAEKQEVFEEEKNKSLNTLIAGIAHEIKNPLTSIRTYSTLIPTQLGNEEFLASFAKFVPKETERINRLIESLISYARPIQDKTEQVNVSEMAGDCLYLTQAAVKKGHVDVSANLGEDLIILANKDQIKQVVINLLMNGIESIEERWEKTPQLAGAVPRLELSAWGEEGQVSISIRDEGLGMTEEELKRCTEPFFTTKLKGSGLGMAIARQYVQKNYGTMNVESEKGHYTRITMKFWRLDRSEEQGMGD